VPSQVLTEDARLLRFLTPTEAWKGHVASRVSLPGEWPLMLVEIFHREDGQISMTCALGVPKSSLKAGDCFLLPRGLPFQLATNPSLEPVHYTIVWARMGITSEGLDATDGPASIAGGHFALTGSHA
jgi:hypothetical protein